VTLTFMCLDAKVQTYQTIRSLLLVKLVADSYKLDTYSLDLKVNKKMRDTMCNK